MKVSDEDREKLREMDDDPQYYHAFFDDLLERRLNELDPEYVTDLFQIKEEDGVGFWYA